MIESLPRAAEHAGRVYTTVVFFVTSAFVSAELTVVVQENIICMLHTVRFAPWAYVPFHLYSTRVLPHTSDPFPHHIRINAFLRTTKPHPCEKTTNIRPSTRWNNRPIIADRRVVLHNQTTKYHHKLASQVLQRRTDDLHEAFRVTGNGERNPTSGIRHIKPQPSFQPGPSIRKVPTMYHLSLNA